MQRRGSLVWSIYALLLVEGLFFTALGPFLPTLRAHLGLSTSEAGLLASAYVSGALVGAAPAALASARLGIKTCGVAGVVLLAAGTLAFGIGASFTALCVAQFVAGVGAAGIWIGAAPWLLAVSPDGERGKMIGAALGAATVGEIVGPALGAVAAGVGRAVTFASVAGVAAFLGHTLTRFARPRAPAPSLDLRASAASRRVRIAVWLGFVPTVVWGALVVLGTLELDRLGASPTAIAVTFVVAAAIGAAQGPLVGRWSDRRGRLLPIRIGLLLCAPPLVALCWAQSWWAVAVLVVVALIAIRFTIAPAVALLSDACQDTGGDILTLALALPTNAAGLAVGSAAAGVLAEAAGTTWSYAIFAAFSLSALLACRTADT